MVKVVSHARQKRRPTRRVYVTLKDGLNRKGPTRSLTMYGVTIQQAEKKILALDEQTLNALIDGELHNPQHPFGNHGPATDRNVSQGAPTPVQTTTDRTPILPADSTQHSKDVTASIEAGGRMPILKFPASPTKDEAN